MLHAPFTPDRHDRIAIARGWRVLGALVTGLALLVSQIDQAKHKTSLTNAANRLARIGEALARRLLAVRALSSPLPKVAVFTRAAREAIARVAARRRLDPCDVRYVPPKEVVPRLKLAEPLPSFSSIDPPQHKPRDWRMPAYREERHGILTVRIHRVGGKAEPSPINPLPPLDRRLSALRSVADDPARATRRMARWLARQRMLKHGRRGPMRIGKPPGQVRARDRNDDQRALADIHEVAQRAQWSCNRHSPAS